MYPDIERKVMTIIRNSLLTKHRTPTLQELMTRTGRSRKGIEHTLNELNGKDIILWNIAQPNEMQLLRRQDKIIGVSEKYRNFMEGNH